MRLRRKDGALIDVEFFTAPWQDAAGNTQGTLAIVTEVRHVELARVKQELLQVTAQEKEARSEIQTERRFRELLEAAPDAIIEVDREGRILLLNLVTEKLFGYTREELLGQPVEILVPDAAARRSRAASRGLLGSSGHPPHGQRLGSAWTPQGRVSDFPSKSASAR